MIEGPNQVNFDAISLARTHLFKINAKDKRFKPIFVAPCPHQKLCPLLRLHAKYQTCGSKCKFQNAKFVDTVRSTLTTNYSYLIIKKVEKNHIESTRQIPRIIDDPIKSKNGNIFRVCTNDASYFEKFIPNDDM